MAEKIVVDIAGKIVVDIAGKILLTLGSDAIHQFGLAWGFKEELKKMEGVVSTINNALLDAQEQRMSNRVVNGWLRRLTPILYDADDLFDEVATETKRREVETRNSLVRKVGTLPDGIRRLTKLQNVRIVGCYIFSTKYEERGEEWRKINCVPKVEVF